MARFSIGKAIGDGIGLVTRRPAAVFVWGLVMVLPLLATYALMAQSLIPALTQMQPGADSEAVEAALMGPMMQLSLLSNLSSLVQLLAMAVVYTAIYRAVIRPRETSWFSLRVGMDEVRVAVVGLAIGLALFVAMMVVMLVFGGVAVAIGVSAAASGGADGASGMGPALGLLFVLLALGFVVLIIWSMARVSLIAPVSVLDRDFAFERGWRLAKGKSLALLGMMILIALLGIAIYLVVAILVGLIGASLYAAGMFAPLVALSEVAEPSAAEVMQAVSGLWPVGVIATLLLSAVYGVFMTLGVAPFASAALQLAGGEAAPAAPEPTVDYQGPL